MINNPVIFYIASALIITSAFASMFAKNIIYSLLSSVVVFFSAAIIFYILGSEYNAIIQASIYGFAVPVIIGLSIMFTSGKSENKKNNIFTLMILITAVIFGVLFTDTLVISDLKFSEVFRMTELVHTNAFDVISHFAKGIYTDYVWAFELLSLLLTIIIAGLVMISSKHGYTIKTKGAGKWK